MGTWNLHAIFSPSGILRFYIFAKTKATKEIGVLKFPELREEICLLDSEAECAHT